MMVLHSCPPASLPYSAPPLVQEMILFSLASNLRAIPSVIDGLKPAQRKILYAAFKRNLSTEMKVDGKN